MSTRLNQSKNQLLYFFILTFIFSWLLWLPGILYTYKLINPTPLILNIIGITNWIGGIGPSLIAFVLVFKNEGKAGAKKLFVRILQFKLGRWYLPIFLLQRPNPPFSWLVGWQHLSFYVWLPFQF